MKVEEDEGFGETAAEVRVSEVQCLEQTSCGCSWLVCLGCNPPTIGVQNMETIGRTMPAAAPASCSGERAWWHNAATTPPTAALSPLYKLHLTTLSVVPDMRSRCPNKTHIPHCSCVCVGGWVRPSHTHRQKSPSTFRRTSCWNWRRCCPALLVPRSV